MFICLLHICFIDISQCRISNTLQYNTITNNPTKPQPPLSSSYALQWFQDYEWECTNELASQGEGNPDSFDQGNHAP